MKHNHKVKGKFYLAPNMTAWSCPLGSKSEISHIIQLRIIWESVSRSGHHLWGERTPGIKG